MTRKRKKKLVKKIKDRLKRGITGTFAIYFLLTSVMVFGPSTPTYALTGGPSQPEVQSFEPVGTSDMVNVFSGDFNYNIPLLDVEGYPINIAYNSGVTMDQEASWTGLGFNINVGTINRALRGLPDDFNGDEIRTELNIKTNTTVGIDASVGDLEIFGKKIELAGGGTQLSGGPQMSMNVGVNYNNYNGVGFDLGFGVSSSAKFSKLGLGATGDLGLNSNSSGGLSITASASLSKKIKDQKKKINSLGGKVGSSFNSRKGLSTLSIGLNMTSDYNKVITRKKKNPKQNFSLQGNIKGNASFDLQQPTYTPTINQSMNSFAISGRVKGALEAWGADAGFGLGASYSQQKLKNSDKDKLVASYGYMYSEAGQDDDNVRHDFNRENQSSVTPATPNLALTNYTYDLYSVSGQGVGGSYRPYRGQIGNVYSNTGRNISSSVPFTIELSGGAWAHLGGEIGVTIVHSKTGSWREKSAGFKGDNKADDKFSFNNVSSDNDFENVSFREANEMSVSTDEAYYQYFGGDEPAKVDLKKNSKFNIEATDKLNFGNNNTTSHSVPRNYKEGRTKRNNTIQQLTVKQVKEGLGIVGFMSGTNVVNNGEDHHIGQIISLGIDGMRYVYGQPAYNKVQKEVTFAVGQKVGGGDFDEPLEYDKGLISYTPNDDNSTENNWGLDHYFQRVTTPDYTHSFLLNAVVSDDYVDVDGVKGPSDGDLGSYTRFVYDHVDDYRWRVPVQQDKASYNEGLKGDPNDDKASYVYGEKELFYLDSIVTKNFIAVFDKSDRDDALGVLDENGGVDASKRMQRLDKISLYSKEDIRLNGSSATPLKEVHFVYDYELCQGIPNNINDEGKLTLKKIYFTYRDSQKGKLSPYEFTYQNNYDYDLKGYDRWGCYKPNNVTTGFFNEAGIATFEYPYVDQNQSSADDYTSAWTLSQIDLPSGGRIQTEFESDDYAYVQNMEAMSMAKIVNVSMRDGSTSNHIPDNTNALVKPISNTGNSNVEKNRRIYFEKDPNFPASLYTNGIDDLYFRCMMEFDDASTNLPSGRFDYVSGYAEIKAVGDDPTDNTRGWILLEPVSFRDDNINVNKNPIALTGVQFGRLHLPKYVWDSPAFNENQTFGGELIKALWQTLANFAEGFKNPNKAIYDKDRGTKIVLNKSWIRLNTVTKKKLGGGCRVKNIRIYDNWANMTNNQMGEADYGQDYDYTKDYIYNGVNIKMSSGVACYEPQIGGDENPFKKPIRFQDKKRWAPDDRFFQEEPLGESFFPSASVGYSKVTVTNKTYANVKRNATGSVIHEFYTAKDFPTRVEKTDLEAIRNKTNPFGLSSLFKIKTRDYYTGSQGFVIETNDMHGKPKSQAVYQESQQNPITKVEYNYLQSQGTEPGTLKVANRVTVIHKNGVVTQNNIGVNFDMVADFQEAKTRVFSAGASINLDVIPIAFIPGFIPTVWPNVSSDKTLFRSAVLTKVVQKFGVLESTVATDLGSVVKTKNLAYDAQTGQVLLTETTTDYNDKIYSLNYPAYWHYDNMGQAYKNIGYKYTGTISGGVLNLPSGHKFVEGDEVSIDPTPGNPSKAWITDITGNVAKFELSSGASPPNTSYVIEVLRSGRRNMQSQMMASITTLENPLDAFQSNVYENVIQASAIEFTDKWRTYCDCNGDVSSASSNPYFIGTRGNYRPKVSYLHLSGRTQSDVNNNTNIRNDGVFESYRPYYRLNSNGDWEVERKDWTYTAEVTEFNPFGQELENQDALGRYSTAQFGFNQTLAKAVAANARYRDIGFTSFEDDDFSACADNHFKFDENGAGRESEDAHSGVYSVRVNPTTSAKIKRDLAWCDQSGCEVDIVFINTRGFVSIQVPTGAQPITTNYDVISGSPTIIPNSNGMNVLKNGSFSIEFNAIDDDGCKATKYLNVENGIIIP